MASRWMDKWYKMVRPHALSSPSLYKQSTHTVDNGKTRVRKHNVSYPPPQMIAFHHIENCAPIFSSRLSIWLLILTVRLPNVGLLGMIAEEVEAPAQKVRQAFIRQTGSKHTSNTTWSSQDFDVASTWHLDTKISHIECVWTPNPTSDLSMETV